jgi:hypothetical protein
MANKYSIRKDFETLMYARETRFIKLAKEKESLSNHLSTLDKYVQNNYYPDHSKAEKAGTIKQIGRIEHKLNYYAQFAEPKERNLFDTLTIALFTPGYIAGVGISLATNLPCTALSLGIPGLCITYAHEKRRNGLNHALKQYRPQRADVSARDVLREIIKYSFKKI